MFLTPREIDECLTEVRRGYQELIKSNDPHKKSVGLYGIMALDKAKTKFVEKIKEKGKKNPPRFF
tara:strand:- start:1172 stop:1366 length:195 start_codon:yes stop_codon:yes gene_type:complete